MVIPAHPVEEARRLADHHARRWAEAVEHVAAFYERWAREKPDLERPNPITYLENRRWKDLPKKSGNGQAGHAETLRYWAGLINGDGEIFAQDTAKAVAPELVANGLVSPERLRERGIALEAY